MSGRRRSDLRASARPRNMVGASVMMADRGAEFALNAVGSV
jgi:hypothetical protein